jgi:MFS family permease
MTVDDYPYATRANAKLWTAAAAEDALTSAPLQLPQPLRDQLQREAELSSGPWKLTLAIALAISFAAVGNGLLAPVARAINPGPGFIVGFTFVMAMVGSIGAQAALLAVLAVWGAGPLWIRQVWHWGLALVAYSAWLFGYLVTFGEFFNRASSSEIELILMILFGLPALALAVQLAAWPAKVYLYWRIVPVGPNGTPDESDMPSADQFSIRDMIVATLVVAASLGALRFAKPESTPETQYWMAWSIACGSAACGSVLVVAMVYLTLGVRNVWLGAVGIAALLGSLAGIASTVLIWLGLPGPTNREIILIMTSIVSGFAFVGPGTLWIVRSLGHRLSMTRPQGSSPFKGSQENRSPFGPSTNDQA